MNIYNTVYARNNGNDEPLLIVPKTHDFKRTNFLNVTQQKQQFYNSEFLTLDDTLQEIKAQSSQFTLLSDNSYSVKLCPNNLIDVSSAFIAFDGYVTFNSSSTQILSNYQPDNFIIQGETPFESLIGPGLSVELNQNPEYIVLSEKRIGNVNLPSYWQTMPVKNFQLFMGNNHQLMDRMNTWTRVALAAQSNYGLKEINAFGAINKQSGKQALPLPLDKLLRDCAQRLAEQGPHRPNANDVSLGYTIYCPLRLLSPVFNTIQSNLIWPTGTPIEILLNIIPNVPILHTGQVTTQAQGQNPNYDVDLTVIGNLRGLITFQTESIKLFYNEFIPKLAVKEVLNMELLREPRLYAYMDADTYYIPCDGVSTVFTFNIPVHTTIVTEFLISGIIMSELWNPYSYAPMQNHYNAEWEKITYANQRYTTILRSEIAAFQYKYRSIPSYMSSFKILDSNFEIQYKNELLFAGSDDVLQQNLETVGLYDGTEIKLNNPMLGVAHDHRFIISPLKALGVNYVNNQADVRSVKIEFVLNRVDGSLLSQNYIPLGIPYTIQLVVPRPAQYEIDIARNVYLYKYPSLKTDTDYIHRNIGDIFTN